MIRAETDPARRIVVDSNFIVRLLTRRSDSRYSALWREWEGERITVTAPSLLAYEVTNAFWQLEQSREFSTATVVELVERMNELELELITFNQTHLRALEIARRFPERKAYDSHFLALADLLKCELWTTDSRMRNRVGRQFPWVRLVDE